MGTIQKGVGCRIWSARSARMMPNGSCDVSVSLASHLTHSVMKVLNVRRDVSEGPLASPFDRSERRVPNGIGDTLASPLGRSTRRVSNGRGDVSERVSRESPCAFGTECAER